MIHPTAIIDPSAKVPASCAVGPYSIIGPSVELGENCELVSHVVIHGPARIGSHNRFFPFCALGTEPQDFTFTGERTSVEIGGHNVIRTPADTEPRYLVRLGNSTFLCQDAVAELPD